MMRRESEKYCLGQRLTRQENGYRASQNTRSCGRSGGLALTRLGTGSLEGEKGDKQGGLKKS